MERLDFSAVMGVLRRHVNEDLCPSQTELVDILFDSFISSPETADFVFDPGQVCRWIKGQTRLSPQISSFYLKPANQKKLHKTIERDILPMMADSVMALQELYDLLQQDQEISERKKEELSQPDGAAFLTGILLFVMSRSFVKRDKKAIPPPTGLSPLIQDLVYDAGIPRPCRWFSGREQELHALHELLQKHDKVFLHGIPGIGKSELAKAYASRYAKEYTNILFIPCRGSLLQALARLDFADDRPEDEEEQRFKRHNRFLRSLKRDTLIIFDNLNTTFSEEPLLDVVCKYRCTVLFTSRNRFEHMASLELKELESPALLNLFRYFYSGTDRYTELVKELIQTVHAHTFAVELIARLLNCGLMRPKSLLEKLRKQRAAMDAEDEISTQRDGNHQKATYHDHIHMLFALFRLSEKHRAVLRNMVLMPIQGVSSRLFANWTGLKNLNPVNQLIEMGILSPTPCRGIALHPMLWEVTLDELPPSICANRVLIDNLREICREKREEYRHCKPLFQTVENIIAEAQKDDPESYLALLEAAFSYMLKKQTHEKDAVLRELQMLLADENIGTNINRARLRFYQACCEKAPPQRIKLDQEALELLGSTDANSAPLAAGIHSDMGYQYHVLNDTEQEREHYDRSMLCLDENGLIGTVDSILQAIRYAGCVASQKDYLAGVVTMGRLLTLLKDQGKQETIDYANVCETIAFCLMMMGEIDTGFNHYKNCLAIYEKIYAEEPEIIEAKKNQIQQNCAKIGIYLGKRLRGDI